VRRFVVLAVFSAAALAACGSAAVTHAPIVFGITGGNIAPYRVSIQPNGSVRVGGSQGSLRRQIPPSRVRQLTNEIEQARLASRSCAGFVPDVASQYIRVGGRTVTVHGSCEAGFRRVWGDLLQAVGLRVT
jgi:hypothetical protein